MGCDNYTRDWVFAATMKDARGEEKVLRLVKAADTPIRRHDKIKAEANPYDPKWDAYFDERLALMMYADLKGRRKLRTLWLMQEGNCPECGEKITKETGWNIHHVLPKSLGGTDSIFNLQLLHPNCHRQLHSQGGK
jgi:RNA-directed DNA polymerase